MINSFVFLRSIPQKSLSIEISYFIDTDEDRIEKKQNNLPL